MIIWVDAQISPKISKWINEKFNLESYHLIDLNLTNGSDKDIFLSAKLSKESNQICILTKDIDFVNLIENYKSPSKIIWLTFGNSSNEKLKSVLENKLHLALNILINEDLVEIK